MVVKILLWEKLIMKKNPIIIENAIETIDVDRNTITSAIVESMFDGDLSLQSSLNSMLHSIILQEIETKNYITKVNIKRQGNEKVIEYLNRKSLCV